MKWEKLFLSLLCLQSTSESTQQDFTYPDTGEVGGGIQVAMVRVILTLP